jgi:putative ABC transport system permease protein
MDQLRTDIRFAIRTAVHHPGFALVSILVMALGIGATAAIFSIVNAVLIRPLPYKDPSQLVAISSVYQRDGVYRSFPTVSRSLESIGSFVFSALPVNIGSDARFLVAIGADPELLKTLDVQPSIGRNLSGSGSSSKESSVIISHRLWREAFQSDPNVIGRSLVMDGEPCTVVGVLPASFQFPRLDASYFADDPDIIFPVGKIADQWGRNSTQWFAIARINKAMSIGNADAELKTITARMTTTEPSLRGISVQVSPLDAATTSSVRTPLLLTMGISIVLLLIACSNIMNLLFSRAVERGREVTVRKALGATTGRLMQQMLTESACLTIFAGLIGVGLARLVLNTLISLSPAHLPVSGRVDMDATVLSFSFLICTMAAIFAGALPARFRSAQDDSLPPATRSSASRSLVRLQKVLMISQIALGVGLLAAAGLLTHSLLHLSSVNPGFRTHDTVAFEVSFPSGHPADAQEHYRRILEATRNVPRVESAGWITNPPPETRAGVFIPFSIPGSMTSERPVCNLQVTSEDYFRTAGIIVSRGRDFTAMDSAASAHVAIINEALARQYFPNLDPLGRHIATLWEGNQTREIVGIISDTHDRGLSAKPVATIYVPYGQFALAYGGVVARTSASPESVITGIRRQVALADPTVPIRNLTTMSSRLAHTLDVPRFYTIMASACAVMAVIFVTLGLYGVISYAVSRRTSEIGIRMALGATHKRILRDVLWQGLMMAVTGVTLGTALSLAATRLLTSLLFEISPMDPITLVLSAATVICVTLAATYLPARRASHTHPYVALRHD